MSALVFVRDGRTLPFVPVTVAAMQAIRERIAKRRPYAMATYVALLEFANENRSDRVAVTQRELVERVGASRSTVQAALGDLQGAGVLIVREQTHGASRVENEYVVVEPGEPSAESDTPARDTGDPRPSDKQLPQEELQENPPPVARARADEIPDGFPDLLRPHARAVTLALREAAVERGANAVTIRAVGRAVMDYSHKPLVRTALELRAWLLDGAGQTRPCSDVVRRYRDWLRKEPDLAALERLADDGAPAGLVAQHPAGVVPLNGRRQSRGERQGEQLRALLRSAGELP
ncbi:MAG: GntR family transcriptional regulator [Chloroflexi bacterium]|nr:GntR family transcriptional regulator [Chloroflexota bacterium]